MRTTIRLEDSLRREARLEAAPCGTTLAALIEEALRERLRGAHAEPTRGRVRLKTVGGTGLCAGVDLDDSAALFDRMRKTP